MLDNSSEEKTKEVSNKELAENAKAASPYLFIFLFGLILNMTNFASADAKQIVLAISSISFGIFIGSIAPHLKKKGIIKNDKQS
ncbi:MAG: hypothetical protein K0U21_08675 [Proteobacteria bacterium]|nr:hypothetical protein [Pseudomonadota bacterium]